MGLEVAWWGVVFISEPGNESHFMRTLSDLIIGCGYPTDTPYCCHAHLFSARTCSRTHTCTNSPTRTQVHSLSFSLSFSLSLFRHQNPLEGNEWNRLSGQLSWIQAFLSFCPCLSFCPSPHPSLQSHSPSLISSTLSQWRETVIDVCRLTRFTHRDVLHSSFSMKKWWGQWSWNHGKHDEYILKLFFSLMQIYSKYIRQWMHSHGAVHYF